MTNHNQEPRVTEQATGNIAWAHDLQQRLMVADDQGDDDLHNLLGEVACCLAALTGRPDTALTRQAAPEAPTTPDWFAFDEANDTMTIYGIKYSGELMRDFARHMPIGQVFMLNDRAAGVLTVTKLDATATQQTGAATNSSSNSSINSTAATTASDDVMRFDWTRTGMELADKGDYVLAADFDEYCTFTPLSLATTASARETQQREFCTEPICDENCKFPACIGRATVPSQEAAPLSDAEFLSKRLARVAKLAGVTMPSGTHEDIAAVAGTILGSIAFNLERAAQVAQAGSDTERLDYIEKKAVRGSTYKGITSIDVIVHADDLAMGGVRYAIDCMRERQDRAAIATSAKGEMK